MKRNSRLSLALHTLCHMAGTPDQLRTSAEIAEHAGTNPVVVRRVLGHLRDAGLLTSEKGHSGGWKLAQDPKDISLADVYRALDEQLVASDDFKEPLKCSVEGALRKRVSSVLSEVETILVKRLSDITLVDVADS